MQKQTLGLRAFAFLAGVAVLTFGGWASADPPSRVARLGYMTGAVSFSPAGENDWVQATINRPLTTGDRLWADAGARAEIQVGGAMIRMGSGTSVSVLNLDDQIAQFQLTQGTLNVRVRRLETDQALEVDTPNLAFTLRKPGEYRIEVDPDGNATTVVVRKGQGEVYGEDAAYVIDSRQPYRFTGTGLREYEYIDAPRLDEFDRWSYDRDRRYDNSVSARYVSQDVVGYQDLDANGTWRVDASYGNVWIPNRVAAGWAPYRDGHWAWVDPWGWTWVDDAPWGFAVSHYGRWTNLSGTWGWVPGPVRTRAYYAPALVAFVGGNNFQVSISGGNVGGVAWFPLGPREVYRPSYTVSRRYFENVNRSNTVINNTTINNFYNNTNVTNVVYANRQVPGAVVAVPTTAFVQSQPVSRAAVQVSRDMVARGPVAIAAHVVPTEKSVRGAAAQGDKPPPRVFERAVVARSAPPAASVGFAAQQPQLASRPGQPLDAAALKALRAQVAVPAPGAPAAAPAPGAQVAAPAPGARAAAPAPVVKVIARAQIATPTAAPPPVAPAARAADGRGKDEPRGKAEQRRQAEQRAQAVAPPPSSPQVAAPAQVAPPAGASPVPAAQAPDKSARPDQRGKTERGQPVTAPPASSQGIAPAPAAAPPGAAPAVSPRVAAPSPAAPPQVVPSAPPQGAAPTPSTPPQATPRVPAAQPPDQRGRDEPRGKAEQRRQAEQRGQPVAPPPAPSLRAAEPKTIAPQAAPLAPAPQPPPQRAAQPAAPPQQIAPPAPAAQQPPQRARAESAPAARRAEPSRAPVAAPAPPPPPQPAPTAVPRGQAPQPAAVQPDRRKKSSEEEKREEEKRKQ